LAGGGCARHHELGVGLHRYVLGELPQLQRHPDAGILIDRERDAGLQVGGKAFFSTCNSYRPTGNRENRNAPEASDEVVCLKPVSRFRTVTRAAGTSAPLSSDTLPSKLAVVYWAKS
jgi:hypothetical protein